MPTHQAESLKTKKHAPEIKRVLDSLPVQNPDAKQAIDRATEDRWEEDSPATRVFFTSITLATGLGVLGALAYLTWVMFTEF